MNVQEWLAALKQCKNSQRYVGDSFFESRISRNAADSRRVNLVVDDDCKACRHKTRSYACLVFKNVHKNFTVFEAGVLVAIFLRKQKPADYAMFHKCIAGKEFIENIESIDVITTAGEQRASMSSQQQVKNGAIN